MDEDQAMREFPEELDQEDMYLFLKEWKLSGGTKEENHALGIMGFYDEGERVATYKQVFERNKAWVVTDVHWKLVPELKVWQSEES